MAINKKLIHFKNKEAFDRELQAGNIMDTSICWIPDAKFIYTRGTYWYCSSKSDAEQGKILKGLVDTKVDKVSGKQLSTNDYTAADKKKFDSLPIDLATDLIPVQDSPEYLGINLIGYSFKELEGIYKPHEPIIRTINPATKTAAGVMTAQDKTNLDETLPNAIAKEVQDRKDADTALDQKLSQAIKEEADARAEYDDNMMVKLGEEENARKAADTALETKLQSNISAEETRAMQAEAENLAIIKAETERAKAAEDEIRLSARGDVVADNGDIPIMPLYRQANVLYNKVTEDIKDTATMAIYVNSYNKPYIGKPFNRIKMMLGTPGRCRISIVNEHIFDANPTEEQSVVKDLVNVMCTSTGYHYWDLDEDVVVEEGQFVGAWYTADCSRYTYNNDLNYLTAYPSGWIERTNLLEAIPKEEWARYSAGYLNIGLYKRGSGSDFEWGKIDETASSNTSPTNMYVPIGQEKLVGKSIYKLRLNVSTIGYLTINLVNKAGTTQASIAKSWKLYIRQLGVQTIRLPEDIILEKGQGIGFYAKGDTCVFKYGGSDFGTTYTLHGYYSYSKFNLTTMTTTTNIRLNVGFIERGGKLSPLEDRTISIQGDSITTFAGTITDGNAAYYSVSHKYVNTIDATWWGLLINECRMRLIRNDAWSGSRISGTGTNAMNNSARCAALKNVDSKVDTYQFGAPEIIVIMAGTNDVSGNVALGEIGSTDVTNYIGAFTMMLRNIKAQCKNSKIVVFQLYRGNNYDYTNTGGTHQYQYQEAMEKVCKIHGAHYVGPEHFGISYPNTNYFACDNSMSDYGPPTYTGADYLHLNMQGMERVYAGVRAYLESLY